jgi:BarA-like signal transduction histidine kinase
MTDCLVLSVPTAANASVPAQVFMNGKLNDYRLKPVGSYKRLKVAVQAKAC